MEIEMNGGVANGPPALVPHDMNMYMKDERGADLSSESVSYRQWKLMNFTLADRRAYAGSGQRFQEGLRAGADLPTPDTDLTPAEREARELAVFEKAHPSAPIA